MRPLPRPPTRTSVDLRGKRVLLTGASSGIGAVAAAPVDRVHGRHGNRNLHGFRRSADSADVGPVETRRRWRRHRPQPRRITLIPLSNATLLTYSAPLWMPLIAWAVSRQQVSRATWIGAAIGFSLPLRTGGEGWSVHLLRHCLHRIDRLDRLEPSADAVHVSGHGTCHRRWARRRSRQTSSAPGGHRRVVARYASGPGSPHLSRILPHGSAY